MRTKVLIVIGQLDIGGAEVHLSRVLPEVHGADTEIKIFAFRSGPLATTFTAAGIEIITPRRRLRRWLGLLEVVPLFLRTLWRERPDVIHYFLPEAYLLGGCLSFFAPKAVRVMSRRSMNDYQQNQPFARALERWLHSRMHAVLANSRAVLEQLKQEQVEEKRLGLIYNGVKVPAAQALSARGRVREALGIAPDVVLFVNVANLIPYKGHRDLIDALVIVAAEVDVPSHLLVIGFDSGIGQELRTFAARAGVGSKISWLGGVENVDEHLAAADIGVCCSHQEGFSNAVLEGMAAGLAMIVTDVGGNGEAIVDGESGLIVPARDPASLARAMLALSRDAALRNRLGAGAGDRVRNRFSCSRTIAQYGQLYNGLARAPRSAVRDILEGHA